MRRSFGKRRTDCLFGSRQCVSALHHPAAECVFFAGVVLLECNKVECVEQVAGSDGMYLMKLADRVARGLRKLPVAQLEPHRKFLLDQQCVSGGFRGREGDGDLYYTGFAVRALAVTGGVPAEAAERLHQFLLTTDPLSLNAVDLLSWLYSGFVIEATCGRAVLRASAGVCCGSGEQSAASEDSGWWIFANSGRCGGQYLSIFHVCSDF